jgi:predicted XRE-type DNA-binding protein
MICRRNLPIEQKIEEHIISKDNCWITDLSSPNGYPRITDNNRKTRKVSRIMFELHYGNIPKGMLVCHKCDNKACINPEHLFLGSHKDNMADMVKKNRQAKGSNQGSSKLSEEQVLEIKCLLAEGKLTQKQIAKLFGVCQAHVSAINLGKKWSHIIYKPTNNFYAPVTINNYSGAKQLSLFDTGEFSE